MVGWVLLLVTVLVLATCLHVHNKVHHPQNNTVPAKKKLEKYTGILPHVEPRPLLPEQGMCLSTDCVQIAGSVLSKIDASVNPCDDFYRWSERDNEDDLW